MMIKTILSIVTGAPNEQNAINTALALSKIHGAQVRFLHISPDPNSYAGFYGEGIIVNATILEAIAKENALRLEQAKKRVSASADRYHVPLNIAESPAHHASAQFIHHTGLTDKIIAREGRVSDLIIAGPTIETTIYDRAVSSALFDTGRPVLLLPAREGDAEAEYKIVTLAWKGTLEASRAMHNAMPFLQKAEKVYVLTAEGFGETYDLDAEAAMMRYLQAHGVTVQGIAVGAGNRAAGEALLLRAKELGSELLVMGAYGHSVFREMLLGGVTEYMLKNADLPLLLSH